jgi:hypothetical protein
LTIRFENSTFTHPATKLLSVKLEGTWNLFSTEGLGH